MQRRVVMSWDAFTGALHGLVAWQAQQKLVAELRNCLHETEAESARAVTKLKELRAGPGEPWPFFWGDLMHLPGSTGSP